MILSDTNFVTAILWLLLSLGSISPLPFPAVIEKDLPTLFWRPGERRVVGRRRRLPK